MIRRMPSEMASERISINTLYSAILFVDRPIHTPLKLINSPLGLKMAHAAEDRFLELRLAPSAYPTHGSNGFDICNKFSKWLRQLAIVPKGQIKIWLKLEL